MQITYGALIPLPPEEAFDFVSDPAHWPTFIGQVRSAEALEGWGAPGGRARMTARFLGREATSNLELVEWNRPNGFRYIAHNEGRHDTDNTRVFEAVPGGTRLTGTTAVHPPGAGGLADLIPAVALRRLFHRGMKQLPGQALKWQHGRGATKP